MYTCDNIMFVHALVMMVVVYVVIMFSQNVSSFYATYT